ncbi:serine acetyltransferase [Mucilaginibacter litoreus]|uniref:Serine acetyltransferase n=1 Tax=Mucilaginibacter litoreus TaxID=1048221 RepID=A0ABW3ALX2_9SPHI
MSLLNAIKLDLRANTYSKKAAIVVVMYRIANHIALSRSAVIRILGYPILKIYQVFIVWLWGIDIPYFTKIGVGLNLGHGGAVVVNSDTVIGDRVLLRQFTTIGNKGLNMSGSPVIGNDVEIGANCVLIGDITIGNNVIIGAGSVVTKSIPADSVAYGNPLKITGRTVFGGSKPAHHKRARNMQMVTGNLVA